MSFLPPDQAATRDAKILAYYLDLAARNEPPVTIGRTSEVLDLDQKAFDRSLRRMQAKGVLTIERRSLDGARSYRAVMGAYVTPWSAYSRRGLRQERVTEQAEGDEAVVYRDCLAQMVSTCRGKKGVAGTRKTILRICDRCAQAESFSPYLAAMGNTGHRAFTPGARSGG